MKMAKALFPFFLFTLIAISAAEPKIFLPQAAPDSLTIGYIQKVGNCSYQVNITTSCLSPSQTSDEIGVLFGDAHGNQIFMQKLEITSFSTFRNCSKDSFNLEGPCTDQICYLYLYKDGPDDWIPETVSISSSDIKTVEFKYNSSIPTNTWFGFDECQYLPPPSPPPPPPPPPSAAGRLSGQKWLFLLSLLVVFCSVLFFPVL